MSDYDVYRRHNLTFTHAEGGDVEPPSVTLVHHLKHTTTLYSLSDHYILSREWRVIVHQVQINYYVRPLAL